MSKLS
ncbi:unnamed protein product [Acanthoscelides obtectus]